MEISMPLYDFQCKCGYRSEEFVWRINDQVLCPVCHSPMERLFARTNMHLLNRQKPIPFKHEPKEQDADKDIWLSVKADAERGKLKKGEYEFWKGELEKSHPEIIT